MPACALLRAPAPRHRVVAVGAFCPIRPNVEWALDFPVRPDLRWEEPQALERHRRVQPGVLSPRRRTLHRRRLLVVCLERPVAERATPPTCASTTGPSSSATRWQTRAASTGPITSSSIRAAMAERLDRTVGPHAHTAAPTHFLPERGARAPKRTQKGRARRPAERGLVARRHPGNGRGGARAGGRGHVEGRPNEPMGHYGAALSLTTGVAWCSSPCR
jgi:hypothetical protein